MLVLALVLLPTGVVEDAVFCLPGDLLTALEVVLWVFLSD